MILWDVVFGICTADCLGYLKEKQEHIWYMVFVWTLTVLLGSCLVMVHVIIATIHPLWKKEYIPHIYMFCNTKADNHWYASVEDRMIAE